MRKVTIYVLALCMIVFSLVACSDKDPISNKSKVDEVFFKSGSSDSNYVELQKVKDNIWVHTSYTNYNGSRTSSNGLIAVTSEGIILIDTPWNSAQTSELIGLTKKLFNKDISYALITHAHEDRMGGIDALIDKKIDIRSTRMTVEEAEKKGFSKPQTELKPDSIITSKDITFEVFYPGEGHTMDNITVWFPQYKVLFGGCLIKSLESREIGSIEDTNIKQWPISINKVKNKYPDAEIVIPGHGKWGDLDLLEHTLDLLKSN